MSYRIRKHLSENRINTVICLMDSLAKIINSSTNYNRCNCQTASELVAFLERRVFRTAFEYQQMLLVFIFIFYFFVDMSVSELKSFKSWNSSVLLSLERYDDS